MNFKCLFSHKYEVIRRVKQKVYVENEYNGDNVYLIKKCERCDHEIGSKIDFLFHQSKRISPEYIRTVYGPDPK